MNKLQAHPFKPIYNENSKVLILGSFPSVKSRENNFYYGNKQNRFWKVLAAITGDNEPLTIEEKIELLHKNRIALWDVIFSCSIKGSSDSSIKDVVPNNLTQVLQNSAVDKIYANGLTAAKLYQQFQYNTTGKEIISLPSTSSANAAYNLEKLCACWRVILECINGAENR